MILASGSVDMSICLWYVKTEKEIQPSHQDIFTQFIPSLYQEKSLTLKVNPYIPILEIGKNPYLLANGALIQQGKFLTSGGVDLRAFLKDRGSVILESQL
ncbi:unnamed protein product [Paramecium sonneborni]|uniref:Uncharacterized protein n=1 Tax=Paramecium sonneborni TaxID=65129 RepID=A0A8S1RTL2_9CILI|nr:unnamed protein product [Paramecium sonneborni]